MGLHDEKYGFKCLAFTNPAVANSSYRALILIELKETVASDAVIQVNIC